MISEMFKKLEFENMGLKGRPEEEPEYQINYIVTLGREKEEIKIAGTIFVPKDEFSEKIFDKIKEDIYLKLKEGLATWK